MFQRICKELRETGSLATQKSERRKRVCHEDNEINVLATVNDNFQITSRQIERHESGINKRSILRIFVKHKYHSYRINLHQDLRYGF